MQYNGVDVSEIQGSVNWKGVESNGIKFAMIRSSYGSSGVDGQFTNNMESISQTAIYPGAYHQSGAQSIAEAISEAKHFLNIIRPYKFYYPLALAIDSEMAMQMGEDFFTNIISSFLNVIKDAKYWPMLYAGISLLNTYININHISNIDIWLAELTNNPSTLPTYNKNVTIWQHSDRGGIKGIMGNANLNISYVDYPTIIRQNGMNHLEPNPNSPGSGINNRNGSSMNNIHNFGGANGKSVPCASCAAYNKNPLTSYTFNADTVSANNVNNSLNTTGSRSPSSSTAGGGLTGSGINNRNGNSVNNAHSFDGSNGKNGPSASCAAHNKNFLAPNAFNADTVSTNNVNNSLNTTGSRSPSSSTAGGGLTGSGINNRTHAMTNGGENNNNNMNISGNPGGVNNIQSAANVSNFLNSGTDMSGTDFGVRSQNLEPDFSEPSFYTVEKSDTLRSIAKKIFGDPEQYKRLMELNGLTRPIIFAGQTLRIPRDINSDIILYRVKQGDTLWKLSEKFLGKGPRYEEIMSFNGLTTDMIYPGQILKIPVDRGSFFQTYTVQEGDTLWKIASKFLGNGNRYVDIMSLNNLENGNLRVGQSLKIPPR